MKKLFSLFIAGTLFMSVGFAQDLGKIYYGIKGGYNYIRTTYSAAKTNAVHGGYIGFMMKIPFDNRLHFTPQVDLNYRGMKCDTLPKKVLSKVSEIQLRVMPLLQIDFKKPEENKSTLFVQFGPSLGFGLKGNQTKQDAAGVPTDGKLKYGFAEYGKFDASMHLGFGYEATGGFRLLLDYAYGLSNMNNADDGNKMKYSTISAGIGYWFGKNKSK